MTICPICKGSSFIEVDRRARVPLLQNRVWEDRAGARVAPAGALSMMFCRTCEFAWNGAFDRSKVLYDPAYDNDQMQSDYFRKHVAAMARRIVDAAPKAGCLHVAEVGCGQGAFLAELAEVGGKRFASLTGFDPAWRGQLPSEAPNIRILQRYFGQETAYLMEEPAQIVVSRHTIEHVPDPIEFLRSIRTAMLNSPDARLFLETPDIGWIFRNFQPQDLFYEHCSLFSPRAFEFALASTGFELLQLEHVFGGQYLWVEARPGDISHPPMTAASELLADANRFVERRAEFVEKWGDQIDIVAQGSGVWVWGASSKGVTFALLVDPAGARLKGAIDINPNKVGRFMPISTLPISAPSELPDGATVIVMNPNYHAEIVEIVAEIGTNVTILNLTDI